MTRRRLTFDFETYAFVPGVQIPPAVCGSFAFVEGPDQGPFTIGQRGVILWRDMLALLDRALRERWLLIGAQTAFDVLVSIYNSDAPEAWARRWAEALELGQVTDVLLRQKLLDGAWDHWRPSYSLGAVSEHWGMPLDKKNPWRTRFGELDGKPVDQYPPDAYRYALEDALATANAWIWQEGQRLQGSPYFPGHDPLRDQYNQTRYAVPIVELASYGLRANADSVRRFKAHETRRMLTLRAELEKHDLVTRVYTRDVEAWARRAGELGFPLPRTKGGAPSTARGALLASGDHLLALCTDWKNNAEELAGAGLVNVAFKTPRAPAQARIVEGFAKQGLAPPVTGPRKRKRGERPEQYDAYLSKFQPSVKTDADACHKCGDPVMVTFNEYSSVVNLLGSAMDLLEQAAREPYHAFYNTLIASGRTATGSDDETGAKGNVQNERRNPGVRECREPRGRFVDVNGVTVDFGESQVYIDVDYSMVELHTFAQICFWAIGWSELGRKLNEGIDVHLEVAADILGITFAEAKARKKELTEQRTAGKAINFGRKGGMGEAKFEQAAWNNYGVDCSQIPGGARRLIELHDARTPEFPLYSRWAQSHAREPGKRDTKFDLVLPYSGRLVAGRGYTDVHNYPFQGLASDVAKVAMWEVWKAKWGLSELGHGDPLYRCGMVLFVHDSLTCEVRESRAFEAAQRLSELMTRAACRVLPDCPSRTEPCIQRQLSKNAKPVQDEAGRLVGIWDAWEACRKDARRFIDTAHDPLEAEIEAELLRKDWPSYVVEDIVREAELPPF